MKKELSTLPSWTELTNKIGVEQINFLLQHYCPGLSAGFFLSMCIIYVFSCVLWFFLFSCSDINISKFQLDLSPTATSLPAPKLSSPATTRNSWSFFLKKTMANKFSKLLLNVTFEKGIGYWVNGRV